MNKDIFGFKLSIGDEVAYNSTVGMRVGEIVGFSEKSLPSNQQLEAQVEIRDIPEECQHYALIRYRQPAGVPWGDIISSVKCDNVARRICTPDDLKLLKFTAGADQ